MASPYCTPWRKTCSDRLAEESRRQELLSQVLGTTALLDKSVNRCIKLLSTQTAPA